MNSSNWNHSGQDYDPNGVTRPYEPTSSNEETRAIDPMSTYQPIPVQRKPVEPQNRPTKKIPPTKPRRERKPFSGCGCGTLLLVLLILAVYLLFPLRTNVLLLGMDRAPDGTTVSRTDTNILVSVNPLKPDVYMLSIPRDLWVTLPDGSQNRINTAHFFAEANQAGSGPAAALETVRSNFGVTVSYYARISFDGFIKVIDAMGGVNLDLAEPMSGYEAGQQHLDGTQALAFVRDRKGSDDFFRMERGQLMIKSIFRQMLNPISWVRIPAMTIAVLQSVDTNLPTWQIPRIALAFIRAGFDGIDNRTISREMVTPFTTDQGANVLLPNWDAINPVLLEMFGE